MTSQPPHDPTHDPRHDPTPGVDGGGCPVGVAGVGPVVRATGLGSVRLFQLRVVPGYRARTQGSDPRAHRRTARDIDAQNRASQVPDAKASSAQTSRGRGSGASVAARIQYLVTVVGMDVVRELRIAHQPRGTITAACVGVAAAVWLLGIYGRKGSVDPR